MAYSPCIIYVHSLWWGPLIYHLYHIQKKIKKNLNSNSMTYIQLRSCIYHDLQDEDVPIKSNLTSDFLDPLLCNFVHIKST